MLCGPTAELESVLKRSYASILLTVLIFGTASAQTQPRPLVILLTMDGLPARALDDPRLPMPTLRSLAANGAVAQSMQPINPTVTWPNHTALITGVDASVHHVMANGLITFPADGSAPEIKPWVPRSDLVHARTLYDAAADKGLTTGQVDWVAIYGAKNVRWEFGERPDVNGPIAQELIAQGTVTRQELEDFGDKSSPARHDEIWTDAAVDIIEKHTPNLLLLHLLQTDSIQHMYGPLTPAAYEAYANADAQLARVVDAVRSIGALDRTTFIITADHGFATDTHTLAPNVVLAQQGLLHKDGSQYVGKVWVKAEGGAAELFIRDPHERATLVPRLQALFTSLTGVEHVYTNEEARSIGIPSDAETGQAPQLYITAKIGYAFSDDSEGAVTRDNPPRGQHGYSNIEPDMQAIFVASGPHIKRGVKLGAISNLAVAPTIAQILGVNLPAATHPPLQEILK